MEVKTHEKIDPRLCGTPAALERGYSRVQMTASTRMCADASGLVHGGFVFGMADYAAMLAVNHPNVVLGAAEVKFTRPVRTGDLLVAEARVTGSEGKKRLVSVTVHAGGTSVFTGLFTCFVLEKHLLD